MSEATVLSIKGTLERLLQEPTPADLWQLQGDLLVVGSAEAVHAREVAGVFYAYLRDLHSKIESRQASRLAAGLATAAVTSVGVQELLAEREAVLQRILTCGVTAMLELGSAAQNVQAWEIETAQVHYDAAWFLYGELWRVSGLADRELTEAQRRAYIEQLLAPVLDPDVSGLVKSALLVKLFQAVLAADVLPIITGIVQTEAC